MPLEWEESDPRYIANAADVKLRAFSTKVCEGGGGGGGDGAISVQAARPCLYIPTFHNTCYPERPPSLALPGAQRGGAGELQAGRG